jgi:hypothetical protein
MLGDDMRRISIVVIMMLVLAACGSPHGGGSDRSSGSPSSGSPSSGGPSSGGPSSDSTGGAYSTVSGQIVDRATGDPYPNAWVKFAWLVDANHEMETHTVTDGSGRFEIQLGAGQYQVTAGDDCDLNAVFAIVGRAPDDVMITVPGTSVVDFVEYPATPGADVPGVCQ